MAKSTKQICPKCGKVYQVLLQHARWCPGPPLHVRELPDLPDEAAEDKVIFPPEPAPLPTRKRYDLFTVTRGNVEFKGCEFNGGFLVLDGDSDSLTIYPSLAIALEEIREEKKATADSVVDAAYA